VYVTYDGVLDPLGQSQVVPYLVALAARGLRLGLISFEKPQRRAQHAAAAARLQAAGITWEPLGYHKRPRLPATLLDVLHGALRLRRLVRRFDAGLVHCRGDVAMAVARAARLPAHVRVVYELRGLFADERAEVGSWRAGGLLDRAVRRVEDGNLRRADGLLIVMAAAGLAAVERRRQPLPPHRVLPNSVDLDAFTPGPTGAARDWGLAYHGSLGGWYLTREMVDFARVARQHVPGRVLFLTPQVEPARAAGADTSWADVCSAAPHEVPGYLRRAQASFFLIQPSPSKRASSPTKFAEALACGLPVAANGASGDLDTLLEREQVGALVRRLDGPGYTHAALALRAVCDDPLTPGRCRRLAETRYSLAAAVAAYHALYRDLERA
jgi:glycosyltransferase involved in cell wall biosynthesis